MSRCVNARGYIEPGNAFGFIELGYAIAECSLTQYQVEGRSVIKTRNTDTTHNLNAESLTKVPLFGATQITTGTSAADFTVNTGDDDVTCNFSGTAELTAHVYGAGASSGTQLQLKAFIDEVEQAEFSVSNPNMGAGVVAQLPFLALSVTTGQKISVRAVKNTISGTITIGGAGSCYATLEKIS